MSTYQGAFPAAVSAALFLELRAGAHTLLADLSRIAGVAPAGRVLPLPGAPAWVLGIGQLADIPIVVTDLEAFLEPGTSASERPRWVVARDRGFRYGLAVDETHGPRRSSGFSAPRPVCELSPLLRDGRFLLARADTGGPAR